MSQQNFATYGRNLIVRPLSRELWDSLGNEISGRIDPPVSESVLCDALVSMVAGDEQKALLELGVASEIEITGLLDDVATVAPKSPAKSEYIKENGDWDKFHVKLSTWPEKLGLKRAENFAPAGLPKDWVNDVKELYRLRNKVVHSGKLPPNMALATVSKYLFAANALFAYCREQRSDVGLQVYSFPVGLSPHGQLVAFLDPQFSYETSVSSSRIE